MERTQNSSARSYTFERGRRFRDGTEDRDINPGATPLDSVCTGCPPKTEHRRPLIYAPSRREVAAMSLLGFLARSWTPN